MKKVRPVVVGVEGFPVFEGFPMQILEFLNGY
jgi:hypothetical protein